MNEKEKILDQLIELSEGILTRINETINKKHTVPISIYLTILETSHDINFLYKKQRLVSATALLRGVIDSVVDLQSLAEDINNAKYLLYISTKNQVKRMEPTLDPRQPDYISDEIEREKAKKLLKSDKKYLEKLKSEGYSSSSHKEKFSRLKMEYFHRKAYQYLCAEVHNCISSIEKRHFRVGSDGRGKLLYLQKYTEDEYPVFNSIAFSLLTSVVKISQILDISYEDKIRTMLALVNSQLDDFEIKFDDLCR